MDPYFNGQSPAAPAYAHTASSFSVPVPVFPTTQQLPQQPQQVREVQTATYMVPFQGQSSPAQNSSTPIRTRIRTPILPPYKQMITEAIAALKEREGSSRLAIEKYIERFYPNLPPGHAHYLTQYLKLMRDSGQLVVVKHSYMLPEPEVFVDLPAISSVPYRSLGRPPKLKPVMNSNAVQQANDSNVPGSYAVPDSVSAAIGLVDGGVEPGSLPKKRPGRPPKKAAPSFSDGSTDQNIGDNSGVVHASQPVVTEVDPPAKRPGGRPFKNRSMNVGGGGPVSVPVTTSPAKGRGRGRPKQNVGVYSGKLRGRPHRNIESPTPLNAVSGEETPAHGGDGAAGAVPMFYIS